MHETLYSEVLSDFFFSFGEIFLIFKKGYKISPSLHQIPVYKELQWDFNHRSLQGQKGKKSERCIIE